MLWILKSKENFRVLNDFGKIRRVAKEKCIKLPKGIFSVTPYFRPGIPYISTIPKLPLYKVKIKNSDEIFGS